LRDPRRFRAHPRSPQGEPVGVMPRWRDHGPNEEGGWPMADDLTVTRDGDMLVIRLPINKPPQAPANRSRRLRAPLFAILRRLPRPWLSSLTRASARAAYLRGNTGWDGTGRRTGFKQTRSSR
jgi:hypothetical protein